MNVYRIEATATDVIDKNDEEITATVVAGSVANALYAYAEAHEHHEVTEISLMHRDTLIDPEYDPEFDDTEEDDEVVVTDEDF